MNSGSIRLRVLLLVGGVAMLVCACDGRVQNVEDESFAFPPTPTFPVVAAPILLPEEIASPPILPTVPHATSKPQIVSPTNLELESESTAPPTATVPTDTPEPPATATAAATPVPSPTPCSTPGQIVTSQFDSVLAGRVNYRIYLPPCYSDSGRTYPTLYMLPGNIHSDSIWDELGLDEAAERGIDEQRLPPFLIVMVSGGSLANNTSGGPGSYESFFMEEFVPYVEGTYCALPDAQGRAIGGMSRGGYWALEIAFRHADQFASVGGHSAALLDLNGGPAINPSQTGLNNDLDDLRIYLDIGENDWLIANVQHLHEQMAIAGREHIWMLNEGIHEEAYWAAHVTEYLDWYAEPWLEAEGGYPPCRAVSADYSS